eukprot:PhF_6_TR40891/c0_g1_i1/m.61840/K21029/moeB; molybdopterin-synthase adenylyltransferase
MSVDPQFINRQLKVPDWNQEVVQNATILILGVGGVGCNLAAAVARIGPKKMILVDYDDVEASNLNRQTLFTRAQIGHRKVDAAAETLRAVHNLGWTEIVPLHFNALTEWGRIVTLAEEATVVFNAIDVGAYFDEAVGSLCRRRRIPYGAASTYACTAIIDFFGNAKPEDPCVACSVGGKKEILENLHVSKIHTYGDISAHVPKDEKPATGTVGSYMVVAGVGSQLLLQAWLNFISGRVVHTWNKLDMANWADVTQFSVERNPKCDCCKDA